tara:strand:- start:198 stop:1130 length:933 start_codon:yes stop_codon:yes gene_type:complete
MAINYTYPSKGQPVIEDEFLIVDTQDGNSTKRVTVDSILDLGSGGDIGVSTFRAIDGNFIEYSPNDSTTGTITLTGDLSATGTAGATNFLRGDNTWSAAIMQVNPTVGDPISAGTLDGIVSLSLGTVPVTKGGTGQTTSQLAIDSLSAVSGATAGYVFTKVGTNASWAAPSVNSLATSRIRVGDSSGVATAVLVSGEISLSKTGATAVTGIANNVSIQGYSPVVTSADSSYEITDDNFGGTIVLTNAGVTAVSITDSASYPVGTEVHLINEAGTLEVAGSVGGTEIIIVYGQGTLKKIASGKWVFFGQVQ